MEKVVDANLIIRYLVEDNKKTSAVENLLRFKQILILTDVTISEIVWVLLSYYQLNKKEIIDRLRALLTLPIIKSNKKLLFRALSYFEKENIDWIDAYLASFTVENNLKEIYSYDKDLNKIKEIKRIEP